MNLGDAKRGVEVVSVDEGSFSEDVGMLEHDVILSINRQPVTSPDDVRKIQGTLKPGYAVAFRVLRTGNVPDLPGHKRTWTSLVLTGTLPVQ